MAREKQQAEFAMEVHALAVGDDHLSETHLEYAQEVQQAR